MVERLNNRIAQVLIASGLGLSAIGIAAAADTTTTPNTSDTTATTPASPSSSTMPPADTSAGTQSRTPAAGATTDSTMAPRGTNPSAATNATAGAADSPAKRIFDQLDTNHDGSLSLEEFSRATFQQPAKQ